MPSSSSQVLHVASLGPPLGCSAVARSLQLQARTAAAEAERLDAEREAAARIKEERQASLRALAAAESRALALEESLKLSPGTSAPSAAAKPAAGEPPAMAGPGILVHRRQSPKHHHDPHRISPSEPQGDASRGQTDGGFMWMASPLPCSAAKFKSKQHPTVDCLEHSRVALPSPSGHILM